ncbi:MAG TPA: carboxypeptidase-like regulatory domain-containing protein [Puia sp.]|nr:carboxypeptidase-like regulatory domain-containing protein [Puia sp.]
MSIRKNIFLLLLISPIALYVKGETGKRDGVVNGYVTDAITKKPLSGVVVSATVPGSSNTTEVLTDADGYFRFAQLPAGSAVTVSFDKKGYQSTKRPNVNVGEKATIKLNIEFQPEDMDTGSDNSEFPILRLLQAS